MDGLSAAGLAYLAGVTEAEVERLVELGILVIRDGPDPFLETDAQKCAPRPSGRWSPWRPPGPGRGDSWHCSQQPKQPGDPARHRRGPQPGRGIALDPSSCPDRPAPSAPMVSG
jgi:hypothetical protein